MKSRYRAAASILLFVLFGSFGSSSIGRAQDRGDLDLRLLRTFGFQAGFQIQGAFSARVSGPEDLLRVTLFLDGEVIGRDEEPPFRIDFNTRDYPAGEHRLWAEGFSESGEVLRSGSRRLIFLTAEEGLGAVSSYLLPVFGLIAIGILLSYLLMMRDSRDDRFKLGEYGPAGGAICRRCALPFTRHFFAPNLLVGKLERCPHCGRWAIVPRATASQLEAAEQRYATDREQGAYEPAAGKEAWRRRIEDTRFED